MKLEVLDVGYGSCIYLEADNKNLMLFDCGHRPEPEFRPSSYLTALGHRSVEILFVTNYDEDHISDLPQIQESMPAGVLYRNSTLSADQLIALKRQSGPISPAMTVLVSMIRGWAPLSGPLPTFPDVEWSVFSHNYPSDFQDTNNLSLAVFLKAKGVTFLIPGDLEVAGWRMHLRNPEFAQKLREVQYLFASHHGRESGYCEETFRYCKPSAVIISDGDKQYATQEVVNAYSQHASGVQFNGQLRKVLTTRSDGTISWTM